MTGPIVFAPGFGLICSSETWPTIRRRRKRLAVQTYHSSTALRSGGARGGEKGFALLAVLWVLTLLCLGSHCC